jgi:K+-sensing histidine kinase KdpD
VVTLKNRNLLQVGLGLAFCKMVVDAHGGNIFVEDNQPVGSVFIVEI